MMIGRYLTATLASLAVLAALWGGLQHHRAATYARRAAAADQAAAAARADAASAREAVEAMQTHVETLRQRAAEAEQLRADIEDRADETLAPDWLVDLPRRLREAADRAAAHPARAAGAGANPRP